MDRGRGSATQPVLDRVQVLPVHDEGQAETGALADEAGPAGRGVLAADGVRPVRGDLVNVYEHAHLIWAIEVAGFLLHPEPMLDQQREREFLPRAIEDLDINVDQRRVVPESIGPPNLDLVVLRQGSQQRQRRVHLDLGHFGSLLQNLVPIGVFAGVAGPLRRDFGDFVPEE